MAFTHSLERRLSPLKSVDMGQQDKGGRVIIQQVCVEKYLSKSGTLYMSFV